MRNLRAAIVGAGIGASYAAALAREDGVDVVAICASSTGRASSIARRYGIADVYTSYDDLLDSCDLDLVVIATPNHLHYPMALAALGRDIHVLCEKPLALSVEQAREMAQRAEEAGTCTFVPFVLRFLPAAMYAKELLECGFVGDPYLVVAHIWTNGDRGAAMHWHFDRSCAGTGALGNIGSHLIHLIDWWLGPVSRVCAKLSRAVPERYWSDGTRAVVDVDDTASLLGEIRDSVPLVVSLSMVTHVPLSHIGIDVFGSDGSLSLVDDWGSDDAGAGRLYAMRAGEHVRRRVPLPRRLLGEFHEAPLADSPYRGAFGRMAQQWVGVVRGERPENGPNFRDALRVQQVMHAAEQSSRRGEWRTVDYTT